MLAPTSPARPIAYLVSQYPAASHTFIRREVLALRAAGVDVRTFAVRGPGADELVAADDRAAYAETTYILPATPGVLLGAHAAALLRRPGRWLSTLALALRHRAPGVRALLWSLFYFVEAIVLARLLARASVRHLHNHFANAGATVGMLAAHFAGLPWSLTLHGISETDYPAGLLLPAKIARAEFVACVSAFGRAQAMRITPVADWPKMRIVRCGLDLATLPPRPEPCITGPLHIVTVGRLSAEKGQVGLIDAFAALLTGGRDAVLTIVGDGPERAVLAARIAAHGITGQVRFAGRLPAAATLAEVAAADLFVLPSFMEGLPVVLMEAMALGVPVIASGVAGIPELIADERSGLLVPPSDWDALGAAMARLADDAALRQQLAIAGRARVEAEFAIDRAIAPLIAAFADV